LVLAVGYVLFMMKYYHLHEEYLASLKKWGFRKCPKRLKKTKTNRIIVTDDEFYFIGWTSESLFSRFIKQN
jgi:hypothetical protein